MPIALFVDDEPAILTAIGRVLREEPYEVMCTTSPTKALEILRKVPVDVIVSDERMPEMLGAELLARVRLEHPDIIRIMLTGVANLATTSRMIGEGDFYRFLSKPLDLLELRRVMRQAFSRRTTAALLAAVPR